MTNGTLIRLRADFNEEENGRIWVSLRQQSFVPDGLRADQRVVLGDFDGSTCEAIIREIRDPIAFLDLDLSTWHDGEAFDWASVPVYEGYSQTLAQSVTRPVKTLTAA